MSRTPRPRRWSAALSTLSVLTLAALAGCGSGGAAADASPSGGAGTRTVDTAYGAVEVPADPQRVAAVSYDTPWQLMALDVTPVAVPDYSAWIDEFSTEQQDFVAGLATVGTYGELNEEAVAAAVPDLIIGDANEVDEATYTRLSQIAPTVIVGGANRGDWQSISEQTAQAVDRTEVWEATRATYEGTRDRLRTQYADVIAAHRWIHFSLGNDASQFSVQQPSGSTGNLVVNELGLTYGPHVPADDDPDAGYGSYPLEQLGTVFDGVTVALTFVNADGSTNPSIQAIEDNPLFQRLQVARDGHVFGLSTSVTDYVTATAWTDELEKKVLSVL